MGAVPMADTTVDTMARGQLMLSLTTASPDTAMADTTERGPLRPSPTTAMAAMVDTDTAMARGLLMPRLTTAVPTAMDMVDTTERGPLMPKLTTAMAAMVDTDMARGPLTPRLTTATPDTDMADTLTASKMLTFRDFKHPPSQCNTPISKSRHPSQKFYKIRAKIFIPKCQEELM